MFDSDDKDWFCSNEMDDLADDAVRVLMTILLFAAGYKVTIGLINGVTHWDDIIVLALPFYMCVSAGIRWYQEKAW
ncbi:hypothetical protein OCT63_20495 [Vibrio sp. RW]|uniref:hypothetical protein n=1 Tax=Vibrio sp. RW TaxID=2998833 RepID=UPI0022CD2260|nr:hypothetical protein [Vibrio sp. RW]MDA0146605.1 hypothetical protein [Vibrio sp. RW]